MSQELNFAASCKLVVSIPLLIALSAQAAPIDTSSLQSLAKRPRVAAPSPITRPGDRPPPLKVDDESKLRMAIDSFTLIINKTEPGLARNKLILDRAKTELALVQMRLMRSKGLASDKYGQQLNSSAKRDTEYVANDATSTPAMRAQSFFLAGVASDDLNLVSEAVAQFQRSLKLDPRSPDAGWMGFYLAEELFEQRKFKEAIDAYRAFYNRWNGRTQRLVLYKMAWAYINMDRIPDGENFFTTIIRTAKRDDIERDSIRDLAYLCSKFRTEKQTLDLADRTFKTDADKMQFLRAVYDQQESQGVVASQSQIFARMMQTEKDPIERIKLKIRALASMQTLYATSAPYKAFLEVKQMMEDASLRPGSTGFDSIQSLLDPELQRLIRAYVDTFSGKVQTPEKQLTRPQVGDSLRVLFASFDRYFPKSQVRGPVFSLWLDVCSDLKDWECVNRVATEIPGDPQLASLDSRAEIERLAALDELVKKDSSHYRADLLQAAEAFVQKNPKHPRWTSVANRLADLRLEDKKNGAAIELLKTIYDGSPTQAAFYRLQWARFSDGRYDEVLGDRRNTSLKEKPDPRLVELYRESALKLALKARTDGNLATYTSQIQNFFAYNTDPKKTTVARRDYISFFLEKSDLDGATKALAGLRAEDRCSQQYSDLLSELCVRKMKLGSFGDVLGLLPSRPCAQDPGLRNLRLIAAIGSGNRVDLNELAGLPGAKREYIVSILALTEPETALGFFKKHAPATDTETSGQLIASRLKRGRWEDREDRRDLKLTSVEKTIERVHIPKGHGKRFGRELKSLVETVPGIRKQLARELKGKEPEVQLRILDRAAKLENTVAELILGSPIPDGLTPDQLKQYKDSLAGLAKGYSDQGLEYQKLSQAAQKVIDDDRKQKQNLIIPRPPVENWPWPNCAAESVIRGFIKSGNPAAALLVADLNRDLQLKNEVDYYRAREGILLYGFPTHSQGSEEVMQRYVLEELRSQNRNDLIQQWKGPSK